MRRRKIFVTPVNDNLSVVAGWGSKDLIVELRGRVPAWSSRPRGWAVQPHTARDLVALAEIRGFDVAWLDAGDAA